MATEGRTSVLEYLRHTLNRNAVQRTDDDLLRQFIAQRDESAFATLVDRHGSLVHGVCRRILGNPHEADDAFQATFFVLARQAASIRQPHSLGPWLYGVASRISRQARLREAVRRRREKEAAERRSDSSADDMTLGELRQLLDEELIRLPEKYRAPLLLCCVQGKTRDEAAHELGWSVGSVKGRLERGREILRDRLARRGVALSAVLATVTLGSAQAAAPALRTATIQSAMAFASGQAVAGTSATLAQAYLCGALAGKVRAAILGLFLLLGSGGLGVSLVADGAGERVDSTEFDTSSVAAEVTPMEPAPEQQAAPVIEELPPVVAFVPDLPEPVAIEEDPPAPKKADPPRAKAFASVSAFGYTDRGKGLNQSYQVKPFRPR